MLCLVCNSKFAVILIPVGKGEVDDVVSRVGDVELEAVGREARFGLHIAASGRCDFHDHLAEVLGEDHDKSVAVKCRDNAAASINTTVD